MLSRRIVRAAPTRTTTTTLAVRRVPLIQQRTFLPDSVTGQSRMEERYPDPATLTDAEDPGMVSTLPLSRQGAKAADAFSRRTVATSTPLPLRGSSATPTRIGGISKRGGTTESLSTKTTTRWVCLRHTSTLGFRQGRVSCNLAPSSPPSSASAGR